MDCDDIQVRYWDVFPKSIRVTRSWRSIIVPLSIRGNPRGDIQFESVDPNIAWVDWQGRVNIGWQPGATLILIYDSESRDSVRYVQVEVIEESGGGYGYE